MKDQSKTKQALMQELVSLRRRIAEPEQAESGRGQAEEAPHSSEDKYRTNLEDIHAVIFSADAEGKITFVSPAIEQLMGYQPGEIEGKNFYQFIHTDDLTNIRRRVDKLSKNILKPEEYRIITSTGTARWVMSYSRPLFRDGIFQGVRGVITDIHYRKLTEEALRDSEEKYRNLFENANEAMFVAQDGKLIFLNPRTAMITGYSAEELLSRPFIEFIHRDDRETVIDRHVRRMKGEELPHRYPSRIIHRDGNIRWVELNAVLTNWNGKAATLNFLSDITDRKLAEDALLKSEEKFRTIFDRASDGILIADPVTKKFLQGNTTICSMLGYTKEEIESLTIHDIHPPKDISHVLDEFEKQLKGEKVLAEDLPVLRKDGSIFYADIGAAPTTIGERNYLVGIFRDITERKQVESALRKSEAEKTVILESVLDMIFYIDTDMRIIYSNLAVEKFFNLPSGSLVGKVCYNALHHRDEPCAVCPALKTLQSGEPHESYASSYGKHWRLRGYSVRDESGKIVGAIEAVSDITDLRNAEEKYRSIFDHAMEGIYQSTLDGRIISANPALAKMFGYDSPETMMSEVTSVGRSLYADPDKRQAFLRLVEEQGIVKNFEFEGSKKDGERIYVSDNGRAVRDSKGNTIYYEGIIQDITDRKRAEEERKRLEEQLKQAQKLEAIGTLAGGIAHDFNNLLMGIQGYASLTLLDLDPSHPHYERLKRMEQMVASGADLTKQLLGFARSGRYEVRPTDMNDIIDKTASMFSRTKKEITVHRSLAQDLWTVEADQGQMEQVFMNLYVNAWQAMPGGGELCLETGNVLLGDDSAMSYRIKPGRYVKVSITDTGTGMDGKTRERIFDPFFTTKAMGRGTGLGLAMVYGIIKGHGGMIDVTSEPGQGTTFAIYLPASEKAIVQEKTVATEILTGTETVLLVDDEQMVMKVTRELLESLGYRVHAAGSGQEAIAVYLEKHKEIDLVILDMIMPGISGGETFDRLREIDPEIRVLLSSGYSIDGQAQQILERGCNGFLQKPFQLEKLSQKLREVLSDVVV